MWYQDEVFTMLLHKHKTHWILNIQSRDIQEWKKLLICWINKVRGQEQIHDVWQSTSEHATLPVCRWTSIGLSVCHLRVWHWEDMLPGQLSATLPALWRKSNAFLHCYWVLFGKFPPWTHIINFLLGQWQLFYIFNKCNTITQSKENLYSLALDSFNKLFIGGKS